MNETGKSLKGTRKYYLHLDIKKIEPLTVSISVKNRTSGEKEDVINKSLIDWVHELSMESNLKVDNLGSFSTDKAEYRISFIENGFLTSLLTALLQVVAAGGGLYDAWFFVEQKSSLEEPRYATDFFVVKDKEIILERAVIFWDRSLDKENLWDYFEEPDQSEIWEDDDLSNRAYTRFMYNKFAESYRGQLNNLKERISTEEDDDDLEKTPTSKPLISLSDLAIEVIKLNKTANSIKTILIVVAIVLALFLFKG